MAGDLLLIVYKSGLLCAFMIIDSLGSARSLRSLRAESLIGVHDAQAKDEGFAIGVTR